jgi:hypothetical protein
MFSGGCVQLLSFRLMFFLLGGEKSPMTSYGLPSLRHFPASFYGAASSAKQYKPPRIGVAVERFS